MGRNAKVPTIHSFSGDGAKEYTSARWMERIQKATTRRALELMHDDRIGGMVDAAVARGWVCLDLGCGNGYSTRVLHEAGFTCTVGLDVSEEMLLAKEGKEPVVLGDIQYLPFRPSTFDGIVSISALNFISQEVQDQGIIQKQYKHVARTIYTILHEGGRAVIEFYPKSKEELDIMCTAFGFKMSRFESFLVIDKPRTRKEQKFIIMQKRNV